ncbi:MAG: hypothetical protein ABI321_23665 [Polyangia bacterium]
MTTPPASAAVAGPRELASTYDQATCASVHNGEADDWTTAAIGEDTPRDAAECPQSVVVPRAPIASLYCNDAIPSAFANNLIGTCVLPKSATTPQAKMRTERDHAKQRALRLGLGAEAHTPFTAPPEHDATPVELQLVPELVTPTPMLYAYPIRRDALSSISGDTLLRPPRA